MELYVGWLPGHTPGCRLLGTPSPCDFIFIAALYTGACRKSIQFLQKITKFISIRLLTKAPLFHNLILYSIFVLFCSM